MTSRARCRSAASAVVALAFLAVVGVGCASGNDNAAGRPAIDYPGRLLVLDFHDPATLRQLTAVSDASVDVGTAPPGFRSVWQSADGNLLLSSAGSIARVGATTVEQLPELDGDAATIHSPTFSLDGARLAYTTGNSGKVVVYDLAAKTAHVVLQTTCEPYGASQAQVCGETEQVWWIDGSTLLVRHFTGDLPPRVVCSKAESGALSSCTGTAANTFSMVGTDGGLTASVASEFVASAVRGSTVLQADGTWLAVAEIQAGVAAPKPLPAGALVNSLSPDGTRIVVPGEPWKVVTLPTGATQTLGTTTSWPANATLAPCAWSPDGQFLAVQDQQTDDILVVPMSATAGAVVGRPAGLLIGWTS